MHFQVSILVNNNIKDGVLYDDSSNLASNVLPNLELAICNFTSIGHEIGNINPGIRGKCWKI